MLCLYIYIYIYIILFYIDTYIYIYIYIYTHENDNGVAHMRWGHLGAHLLLWIVIICTRSYYSEDPLTYIHIYIPVFANCAKTNPALDQYPRP